MKQLVLLISILLLGQSCVSHRPSPTFADILWATAWHPTQDLVAVGGNHGQLRLLSTDRLTLQQTYPMPNTITQLQWHPTETTLAVARQWNDESGVEDDRVLLLDLLTGANQPLPVRSARGLAWSPTGEHLAIGDNDGQLSVFTAKGELVKVIDADQKGITALAWHPTEDLIVTVGSRITLVDPVRETLRAIQPREQEVLLLCVAWHPSGAFFVTGDYGDYRLSYPPLLQWWDTSGQLLRSAPAVSEGEYRQLRWSPDGRYLATASDKIIVWDAMGQLLHERDLGYQLWSIDWNRDQNRLVTSSEAGTVTLLNDRLRVLATQKSLRSAARR